MTWPGTHPDTEAGKPNTTDPAEPENHTPTKATTPTTEPPPRPPDDTTAGQNDPAHDTKPSTFRMENEPEARMLEPESATPDTDSPPSADHDTDSENSSNTRENTDPSPSDASDAGHRSATASLRDRLAEAIGSFGGHDPEEEQTEARAALAVFATWLREYAIAISRHSAEYAIVVNTMATEINKPRST